MNRQFHIARKLTPLAPSVTEVRLTMVPKLTLHPGQDAVNIFSIRIAYPQREAPPRGIFHKFPASNVTFPRGLEQ